MTQTLDKFDALGLFGMALGLLEQLESSQYLSLSFDSSLGSGCSSSMTSAHPRRTSSRAKDLLEVIDDRSQVHSTLVVSQLPVDAWHPALAGGDPTLADAIVDRLVHNAHRLALNGASLRRRQPPDAPDA